MSLPSSIRAVLAHFEPLFTAPTWKKVVTLLVGTLLARGRRTVTTALRQMGHQMNPQFSVVHHVLNRARWSSLEVSRRLLQVLVATFVGAGGTVEIVIDETLERSFGRKISKRGDFRDSLRSSKERSVSTSGIRWVTMALVVSLLRVTDLKLYKVQHRRCLTTPTIPSSCQTASIGLRFLLRFLSDRCFGKGLLLAGLMGDVRLAPLPCAPRKWHAR